MSKNKSAKQKMIAAYFDEYSEHINRLEKITGDNAYLDIGLLTI